MNRIALPGLSTRSSAATLALLLCSTALPASAQSACVLDTATSVYICSGTGTGLDLSTTDALTVTVAPGAAIDYVYAGDDLTLTNAGTLNGSPASRAGGVVAAIEAGEGVTIVNSGTILSEEDDAIRLGNGAHITNSGLINSGYDDAIEIDGTGTLINEVTGVITSYDDAVSMYGDGSSVDNAGRIEGDYWGLALEGDDIVVVNRDTGLITGDYSAVQVWGNNADIGNSGSIYSEDDTGIEVDGDDAVIRNSGLISAYRHAIVVQGDFAQVFNTGTLESGSEGMAIHGLQNSVVNDGTILSDKAGVYGEGLGFSATNNGTITARGWGIDVLGDEANVINNGIVNSEGLGILTEGDFASVTNNGTIHSIHDGIYADGDNAWILNTGAINAGVSHVNGTVVEWGSGILAEDDGAIVENRGVINATDYGILTDDYASILNSGTINAGYDGIEAGDASLITNTETGVIRAVERGIEVNSDFAEVRNYGSIESGDDGIEVGDFSYVFNAGTVLTTVDGNAVDIDSGTVVNTGSLIAIAGDGIGFDEGEDDAVVYNSGLIQGEVGISDDLDGTRSIEITNAGTITGTSGVAISLAAGDDTLRLERGSKINGIVEMGDGDDALIIAHDGFERVDYGSEIESIEGQSTLLIGTSSIVQLDEEALVEGDFAAQRLAFGISRDALSAPAGAGFWATGNLANLSANDTTAAGVALGYDHGLSDAATVGLFVNRSRAAGVDGTVVGLRYALSTGAGDLTAMAYTGQTTGKELAGDQGADGRTYGVGLRYGHTLRAAAPGSVGFDVALEGGWSKTALDAYTLTDLDTKIGARDVTGGYTRLELGAPVELSNGAALRGYVAASRFTGSSDAVAASIEGASALVDGADLGHTAYSIGGTYSHQTASGLVLKAGVEASFGQDDNRDISARFSVRMPLGR